jgi:hypothetical protein
MADETFKLPAGWLIEQAGMKGHASHGFKTFETNALVVVNESGQSYADLEAFRDEIVDAVFDMFRLKLEQEPELLQPTTKKHDVPAISLIKKNPRPLLGKTDDQSPKSPQAGSYF